MEEKKAEWKKQIALEEHYVQLAHITDNLWQRIVCHLLPTHPSSLYWGRHSWKISSKHAWGPYRRVHMKHHKLKVHVCVALSYGGSLNCNTAFCPPELSPFLSSSPIYRKKRNWINYHKTTMQCLPRNRSLMAKCRIQGNKKQMSWEWLSPWDCKRQKWNKKASLADRLCQKVPKHRVQVHRNAARNLRRLFVLAGANCLQH